MVYLTWLAATLTLGFFPRGPMDDPKTLGPLVVALHTCTFLALFSGWLVFGINIGSLLVTDKQPRRRKKGIVDAPPVVHFLMACVAWAIVIAMIEIDPGGIIEWFID